MCSIRGISSKNILTLISLIYLSLNLVVSQRLVFPNEGDDLCTMTSGVKGHCRALRDCPYAMRLMNENRRLTLLNELCSFSRNVQDAKICCPIVDHVQRFTFRAFGEKAKAACRSFGSIPEEPMSVQNLIMGGKRSDIAEFPHVVALGYAKLSEVSFDCGGALITDKFVLTAAHCCSNVRSLPRFVRIGRVSLKEEIIFKEKL